MCKAFLHLFRDLSFQNTITYKLECNTFIGVNIDFYSEKIGLQKGQKFVLLLQIVEQIIVRERER